MPVPTIVAKSVKLVMQDGREVGVADHQLDFVTNTQVARFGTELELALKLNPCPREGKLLQGLTYAGQGEDGLAIAVLQELVENNPEPPPEAYYEIGKIYEKQEKTSEALAAYRMALKILLAR